MGSEAAKEDAASRGSKQQQARIRPAQTYLNGRMPVLSDPKPIGGFISL
jgi:hypothetical protein